MLNENVNRRRTLTAVPFTASQSFFSLQLYEGQIPQRLVRDVSCSEGGTECEHVDWQ